MLPELELYRLAATRLWDGIKHTEFLAMHYHKAGTGILEIDDRLAREMVEQSRIACIDAASGMNDLHRYLENRRFEFSRRLIERSKP